MNYSEIYELGMVSCDLPRVEKKIKKQSKWTKLLVLAAVSAAVYISKQSDKIRRLEKEVSKLKKGESAMQ